MTHAETDPENVACDRTRWLSDLDAALSDAESLTTRLLTNDNGQSDAGQLLTQIRLARATLQEMRFGIAADHPEWLDLFRSLAALGGSLA